MVGKYGYCEMEEGSSSPGAGPRGKASAWLLTALLTNKKTRPIACRLWRFQPPKRNNLRTNLTTQTKGFCTALRRQRSWVRIPPSVPFLGTKCPGASDRVGASITICNLKYFNWDGWLCFNPGPRSLSPAHDNGVVYQEIKPQNILLAEDEIVKV